MTTQLEEAARLAKELEGVIADVEEGDGFDDVCLDTVKYVRDQLMKQPAQDEPVAYLCKREDGHLDVLTDQTCKRCFPVYTRPQPVPTSDTSQKPVDETSKQRHEPVIDKAAAVRIATALGWKPPQDESRFDSDTQRALDIYAKGKNT